MRISLIIPTVDRAFELIRLLGSLNVQSRSVDEIIVVCQGDLSADVFLAKFPKLPLKWIVQSTRSLTQARNTGVRAATGDIIGFLDDDCVVESEYIEKVAAFFAAHPSAKGAQGVITNFVEGHTEKVGSGFLYGIYNIVAKFFLLNNSSTKNKFLLSGRNQYASIVLNVMPCEWLSGVGNYRSEVFLEFHFDETLTGYALGEDKLFSYSIHQKYPGSLYIDPAILLSHHHGTDGRPKSDAWVKMRVQNTYYIWKKLCAPRGMLASVSFWWANLGDVVVVFFAVLLRKFTWKFLWWHIYEYWQLLWKKN